MLPQSWAEEGASPGGCHIAKASLYVLYLLQAFQTEGTGHFLEHLGDLGLKHCSKWQVCSQAVPQLGSTRTQDTNIGRQGKRSQPPCCKEGAPRALSTPSRAAKLGAPQDPPQQRGWRCAVWRCSLWELGEDSTAQEGSRGALCLFCSNQHQGVRETTAGSPMKHSPAPSDLELLPWNCTCIQDILRII